MIGAVATNARLTKSEATKVAQMAHDGLARAVRPAHTMLDGDTIFALSTGNKKADVTIIGAFAGGSNDPGDPACSENGCICRRITRIKKIRADIKSALFSFAGIYNLFS